MGVPVNDPKPIVLVDGLEIHAQVLQGAQHLFGGEGRDNDEPARPLVQALGQEHKGEPKLLVPGWALEDNARPEW